MIKNIFYKIKMQYSIIFLKFLKWSEQDHIKNLFLVLKCILFFILLCIGYYFKRPITFFFAFLNLLCLSIQILIEKELYFNSFLLNRYLKFLKASSEDQYIIRKGIFAIVPILDWFKGKIFSYWFKVIILYLFWQYSIMFTILY